MPDNTSIQRNEPPVEEAMWRLKVDDGSGNNSDSGLDGSKKAYPVRPGVDHCLYFVRHGVCGYGMNCKYNHPKLSGKGAIDGTELPERKGVPDCPGAIDGTELPERKGVPDCPFFLKTGTCKYGPVCKFNHPRGYEKRHPPLNTLGLPIRQDVASCPFYMLTRACKFGIACKFSHPEPPTMRTKNHTRMPSTYGPTITSVQHHLSDHSDQVSPWSFARPHYVSSPRIQGFPAYVPFIPIQQGWSANMAPVNQLNPVQMHAQLDSNTMANLPKRPGQPECQYYLKTGKCKFGTNCMYHHPKEQYSVTPCTLGPTGLPMRPGNAVCPMYTAYGNCTYGSTCEFDHPLIGFYNYVVPNISVPAPTAHFYPNPKNVQHVTSWVSEEILKPAPANSTEANSAPDQSK